MKRVIAILLSVVLAFGCMALTASALEFAEEGVNVGDVDAAGFPVAQYKVLGTCNHHFEEEHTGSCTCCVLCPNVDVSRLSDCARGLKEDGSTGFDGYLCCKNCTGMWGCNCGCPCCGMDHDIGDTDNTFDKLWGDQEKENFVNGFQAILKVISDAFDKFFDAIFEFLRLDEVLGRN